MALARLCLKNFQQKVPPSLALIGNRVGNIWDESLIQRISTSTAESQKAAGEKSDGREISVSEGRKKSNLSPRKRPRNIRNLVPFGLSDFLRPSGIENALGLASESLSRMFGDLTPSRLFGQVRESDKAYRLRYEVPGLKKDDLKITVEDGCLVIRGEHNEEEGSDDDDWFSAKYGYYTSFVLPDDAKVDELKAEMKDGVVYITIPKTEKQAKDVKEVEIH